VETQKLKRKEAQGKVLGLESTIRELKHAIMMLESKLAASQEKLESPLTRELEDGFGRLAKENQRLSDAVRQLSKKRNDTQHKETSHAAAKLKTAEDEILRLTRTLADTENRLMAVQMEARTMAGKSRDTQTLIDSHGSRVRSLESAKEKLEGQVARLEQTVNRLTVERDKANTKAFKLKEKLAESGLKRLLAEAVAERECTSAENEKLRGEISVALAAKSTAESQSETDSHNLREAQHKISELEGVFNSVKTELESTEVVRRRREAQVESLNSQLVEAKMHGNELDIKVSEQRAQLQEIKDAHHEATKSLKEAETENQRLDKEIKKLALFIHKHPPLEPSVLSKAKEMGYKINTIASAMRTAVTCMSCLEARSVSLTFTLHPFHVLQVFKDPVTLACGHSVCVACSKVKPLFCPGCDSKKTASVALQCRELDNVVSRADLLLTVFEESKQLCFFISTCQGEPD